MSEFFATYIPINPDYQCSVEEFKFIFNTIFNNNIDWRVRNNLSISPHSININYYPLGYIFKLDHYSKASYDCICPICGLDNQNRLLKTIQCIQEFNEAYFEEMYPNFYTTEFSKKTLKIICKDCKKELNPNDYLEHIKITRLFIQFYSNGCGGNDLFSIEKLCKTAMYEFVERK